MVIDLLFIGSVLSAESLEYRTTARAIGHDEARIYIRWRKHSANPAEVILEDVVKMEIVGSRRGGIGIFLPDGTEVEVYPGLEYGSTFVQSLLRAWAGVLAARGKDVVTKQSRFFWERLYMVHPSGTDPDWSVF